MKLTLKEAEQYVSDTANCRWDNYTLCLFNEDRLAEFSPNGVRVSERWGYEKRIDCDENGLWTV